MCCYFNIWACFVKISKRLLFGTFELSQFKSFALISMDFVASKYCINQENAWIPKDCFELKIIVNTLLPKNKFYKIKINIH